MNSPVTLAEFARQQGYTRSHVTRLKQAGRLVTVGEGRAAMVKVDESVARIEQTRGLRDDVARRHREAKQKTPAGPQNGAQATQTATGQGEGGYPSTPGLQTARDEKVMAETRRVMALADVEEMNRDKLAGNLIAREDVDAAMKAVGSRFRALTDVFVDQLAPVLQLDEDKRAALADGVRDLQQRFADGLVKDAESMAREGV